MALQMNVSHHFFDLGPAFFSPVTPRPLQNAEWVAIDNHTAKLITLDIDTAKKKDGLAFFSGNAISPSSKPLAMVYSGHQFGQWAGQLGDGRGMLLGERKGENGSLYDLHLKGAGQTPYSRFGDGYAVLRSCIREYLASIALHNLGIPTTHALCITRGDNPVTREQIEPAAMLTRVAKTHIRFGSFQHFYAAGEHEKVRQLADYVLAMYLPALADDQKPYAALLDHVVTNTAELIAHWQAKGFAHGVMNTDNMSILGETLDYGPYGFMEHYNHYFICNHSDNQGRYAFDQQPNIGLWNLYRLAESFSSLIPEEDRKTILNRYEIRFMNKYYRLMSDKLGIALTAENDEALIEKLIGLLQTEKMDYTLFFRHLSKLTEPDWHANLLALCEQEKNKAALSLWLVDFKNRIDFRLKTEPLLTLHQLQAHLTSVNPKYILRNYLAQKAIDLAYEHRDYSEIATLEKLLKAPFSEHPEQEEYANKTPAWASHIAVSCSS